jgi:DNA helicase HerA-like ATPase
VLNRLENAVMYQLEGLLNRDDTRANPIPIGELRGGELWVIDISKIHDKGQRLVFHSVVRTVYRLLEAKRTGEERVRLGTAEINIHEFPNRVVLLVDELNKFAPSGKENSAIKQDIVEIAARGRSVGLALIGIQQLASKVDDEVLTNSNTLVVGRTHAAEIRDAAYNWLPAGLKDRAIGLDKGRMLVWHAAHKRPVFVHFPVPLHCLLRA